MPLYVLNKCWYHVTLVFMYKFQCLHKMSTAGRYVPWVDEGRQLCVFENYNLPLEKCARLYGEDVVASWPREGSDVGPFNIPGANLGGWNMGESCSFCRCKHAWINKVIAIGGLVSIKQNRFFILKIFEIIYWGATEIIPLRWFDHMFDFQMKISYDSISKTWTVLALSQHSNKLLHGFFVYI